jgi:hypothetical protein
VFLFHIEEVPAPAISINHLNLRKKRKGMDAPVQQQPQILFAIFSVGEKKAQKCLKAYRD